MNNEEKQIKLGDFSKLATSYSNNRPNYSKFVLNKILKLLSNDFSEFDVADVGAGTGIWTRMLNENKFRSITAIEPNNEMRHVGQLETKFLDINWINGSAENTTLKKNSINWVTMASSFHWTDPKKSTEEFNKILKSKGYLTILWNPRVFEKGSLLEQIENYLYSLKPDLKRVSSGKHFIYEDFKNYFEKYFESPIYYEGNHKINMTKERYINIWMSVNDIRFQLG
ncbi:class I SAM-dependent methyltransferase, partial [Alphaproteobacteria bacterium]|nr:class I SAM-dependent methyltransferase [Alphaproteobacteria bacterium]